MSDRIHLLLFDIDGTLLLSGGAGARALDQSFHELFGVPEAMSSHINPHGKTDRYICQEMIRVHLEREATEEELDRLLARYVEHLPQTVAESKGYRLMPGIPGLLERLLEREDVAMGLGTGNVEPGARIKLGRAGLNRFFSFGGFGCDDIDRNRLIEIGFRRGEELIRNGGGNNEIIRWVVGDTWRDVEAGRASGARVVAVATGGNSLDELGKASPDHLFADFGDPSPFLDVLDGP